jgi:hypothetical protein
LLCCCGCGVELLRDMVAALATRPWLLMAGLTALPQHSPSDPFYNNQSEITFFICILCMLCKAVRMENTALYGGRGG